MPDQIKILIVEDDQYLLTLFRFALTTRNADFDITAAGDGETALEMARAIKPDLMLLDILLPGRLDGIEVCHHVRSDPNMRGVGIVIVTALDDLATRQRAIEAGAADYWTKPVSTRHLHDRVRAILNVKPGAPRHATAVTTPVETTMVPRPSVTSSDPNRPGLDTAMAALRTTFAELEPTDWAEIQALAEARATYKKRAKAGASSGD